MMPNIHRYAIALVILFLCHLSWAEEVLVPQMKARVTDLTQTLTTSQQQALEHILANLEQTKGSQVVVLIINTTKPETIEQFSIKVVEKWRLGRKKVDDGVLFLIAKQDKKMRIEVGYGLEGALTDAMSKRIIEQLVAPRFRKGEFYQGIKAGVLAIVKKVEGEPLPEIDQPTPLIKKGPIYEILATFSIFFFIMLFVLQPLLRKLMGNFFSSVSSGSVAGILLFFITGSIFAAFIFGFVFCMIALVSSTQAAKGIASTMHRRGGFYSTGGFGSSGGFGGGFSGGGGGFGGGGASGGW